MSLTSIGFFAFFAAACIVYFVTPARYRRFALLFVNLCFYAFLGLEFTITLAAVIGASYLLAFAVERAKRKRLALGLSVALIIGALVALKYLGFIFSLFGGASDTISTLIAPIGLSFYTLTCVGYLIDVYRGKTAPEKSFIDYSLFVGLFVGIMSGPIPRSYELLPQVRQPKDFDFERLKSGFARMVFGLAVKLVVADNLAASVNHYFSTYINSNSYNLLFAALLYGVQIYCDFRAYTDIVLGAGEILGFTLPENFKAPYLSRNIREFWRRWHISLSSWFRDYLYFPLGGSRCCTLRIVFNTLVVFALSGLWHGASLNFLVWGLIHGVLLSLSVLLKKPREFAIKTLRIKDNGFYHKYICPVIVFLLTDFAWIFFRAPTFTDAINYIWRIFKIPEYSFPTFLLPSLYIPNGHTIATLVGIVVVFVSDIFIYRGVELHKKLGEAKTWVRFAVYYALLLSVMFFGTFGSSSFIYFNF